MTAPAQRAPLPERAGDTTAEHPWPVRLLSMKIAEYVEKMSVLWVEGQVVQLTRRPGQRTAYLTLRDPDVDMSLSVAIQVNALDAMPTPLTQGARVVLQAKPVFWTQRGSLMLDARQIRPVGVGELLARVEHLKRTLASEGLFDPDRKRSLPFLPHTVGLICGRAGAAEKDVVENARRRWPTVRFAIREVAVQGGSAVQEVMAALQELDADPKVDVIVIARGGGSVEDLLPFSNEALVRAVAAARTPVVSAIGHDVDTPLLDHVADWRASTPTDAGKRVVPDAQAERHGIRQSRDRGRRALHGRVADERRQLTALQSRPVMARPVAMIDARRQELDALTDRAHRRVLAAVHRAADQVEHLRVQVRTLSPLSTLERGYAVVQHRDGRVVTDRAAVVVDEVLRVRVARGDFAASVVGLPGDAGQAGAPWPRDRTRQPPPSSTPRARRRWTRRPQRWRTRRRPLPSREFPS